MDQFRKFHENIGYIVEASTLAFLLVTGYVLFHAFSKKGEEKGDDYQE